MEIYSIGFTQKTAAQFFGIPRKHGIKRLLDVRLNNSSQLAALTKRDDLAYFLEEICGARYEHEPALAPTKEMLDEFKKKGGSWDEYEARLRSLMAERKIEDIVNRESFEVPTVLLCSEATPERCHRRIVLEYLNEKWGGLRITHL